MDVVNNIDQIKTIISNYSSEGKPITYKNLTIEPIKVSDYTQFAFCHDILSADNAQYPSKDIIKMNSLEFYFLVLLGEGYDEFVGAEERSVNLWKFDTICRLCLNVGYADMGFTKDDSNNILLQIKSNNTTDTFTAEEFDFIRRVILYQNIFDYDDRYISPDMKQAIKEYYAFANKDSHTPNLEEKESVVSVVAGLTIKDMKDMTYREFCNIFERCKRKVDYSVLTGKTKEPIPHWIYGKTPDFYERAFSKNNVILDMAKEANILNE